MTAQRPVILISGGFSELPPGDTVAGVSLALVASPSGLYTEAGALGYNGEALASGVAAQITADTALASGVAAQVTANAAAKLDAVQTFTAVQTLTNPAIIGTIKEDVYVIPDAAAFEVIPASGSVQLVTLGANRTPKATTFAAGEAVTLMVDDGSAFALTWTDPTWGSGVATLVSGLAWIGGEAPELTPSGFSVIQFWKVSTQVYGAYVGDVA